MRYWVSTDGKRVDTLTVRERALLPEAEIAPANFFEDAEKALRAAWERRRVYRILKTQRAEYPVFEGAQ